MPFYIRWTLLFLTRTSCQSSGLALFLSLKLSPGQRMSNEELCVLARNGSIDARDQLLENNLAFIQQQANQFIERYGGNRLDVDDLIQEGCFGLMEAISRFVPERGTKFLTYAVWWIRKFMQESVSIVTASDEISLDELEDFSLPQAYRKSPEQIVLQAETYAELHEGLRQISARERTYLLYRYGFTDGDEHPIPETAAHFRLTVKRAQKTEQAALNDLRRRLPH
ncbi:sigma-70 family RNA polymerase sigma factor [Pseudoflavonifractor sp. 60]|nr:sigma-70 family RNA polymerase sigma factor [Pseudoflavonifractor sp. 60]